MTGDEPFRWVVIGLSLAALLISSTFRRRARRHETIARSREGWRFALGRLAGAILVYGGTVAYMVNPAWMAWSSVPVPAWVRWTAAALGLALLGVLVWVFRTIGANISETTLTKTDHRLVTDGPYRWVRHPLYASAGALLLLQAMVAANVWLLATAVLALVAITAIVVPREEANLEARFGDAYRRYRRRTGRLLPRLTPPA